MKKMKAVTLGALMGVLAFGGVLLSSSPASAQERPADRPVMRPNSTLLIGGSALLVGAYVPSMVVAASSDHDGDKWLYVPVVGPWADLAGRGGCGDNSCGTEAAFKILLIGSGVAQVAGAGGIIASFLIPERQEPTMVTGKVKPTEKAKPT